MSLEIVAPEVLILEAVYKKFVEKYKWKLPKIVIYFHNNFNIYIDKEHSFDKILTGQHNIENIDDEHQLVNKIDENTVLHVHIPFPSDVSWGSMILSFAFNLIRAQMLCNKNIFLPSKFLQSVYGLIVGLIMIRDTAEFDFFGGNDSIYWNGLYDKWKSILNENQKNKSTLNIYCWFYDNLIKNEFINFRDIPITKLIDEAHFENLVYLIPYYRYEGFDTWKKNCPSGLDTSILDIIRDLCEDPYEKMVFELIPPDEHSPTCNVCLEYKATHCFYPCGHLILCEACTFRLNKNEETKNCVLCRKPCSDIIKIFS